MPDAMRIPSLRLTDIDGTPDIQGVERVYLTDGFLTDMGGGNALLSLSGSAPIAVDYWVETADAGLSAEVVVGTTGITTAAYGSRQAAAKAGRLFLPNNSFYLERDTGSAWTSWGPIFPMTPPVDGDYSWFNQGGASVSTTNGGIFLSLPSTATTQFRGRTKAKTAPYTITAAFMPIIFPGNFARLGIFFTDGTATAVFGIGYNTGLAGNWVLSSSKFTNSTTISADYTILPYQIFSSVVWLRIADDSTNRVCSISNDGVNFVTFHSVGRTDFLTATSVGFGGDVENSAASGLTLLSWKET